MAAVVGCCSLEDRLLYHPTRRADGPFAPAPLRDVALHTADGTTIHARWRPHPGADGAVLFCHGNAGDLTDRTGVVERLGEALGESVLVFDYPGYGYSNGEPSELGCYAAADAAYTWLTRTQGVGPEHVIIYGESLGGGVAVDLASRVPHRALVLVKTFTSVPDVAEAHVPLLPARWLMPSRFDNLVKIARCRQPVFIAQGDADRLIPFVHGQQLAAANPRAQLFVLHGADHNGPLGTESYAALRRFLDAARCGEAQLRRSGIE
jgi:pimeloyl-ACP methyl ester carboxylesterase